MKRLNPIILLVATLILFSQAVEAQQSDYQISSDFQEQYRALKSDISSAISVSEVDSLMDEVDSFEEEFSEHEELLDGALYPVTFEDRIEDLRQDARSAEHKLLIIENQNEKLSSLTDEVASYESEITNLNSRAESLRNAITTSEESERQLSSLVQRYRNSMEERDEFILTVIDSLLIAYEDIDPQAVSELSEETESGEISDEENPLQIIHSIIENNTQRLKTADESLDTEDYLRMYVVQTRFSDVWDRIGTDLVTIYGGDEKNEWENTISDHLSDWRASASKNMWESINNHLEQENVQLEAFDNNESFYNALNNYVNNNTEDGDYDEFENFNEFWSGKVKDDWSEYVQEGNVLTMSQISSIDNELITWREEAQPRSYLIPILLGVSLLIIIGLIIVIARK